MSEFKCENCGAVVNNNDKECPNCGCIFDEDDDIEENNSNSLDSDFESKNVENNVCHSCGNKVETDDYFCPSCGSTLINCIKNINKNINGLLSLSTIFGAIYILISSFSLFAGLISCAANKSSESGDDIGFSLIICSIVVFISGLVINRLFKWMAYMLYTNTKNKK